MRVDRRRDRIIRSITRRFMPVAIPLRLMRSCCETPGVACSRHLAAADRARRRMSPPRRKWAWAMPTRATLSSARFRNDRERGQVAAGCFALVLSFHSRFTRVLREPVTLAYLLARTTDTIADSTGCLKSRGGFEILDKFSAAASGGGVSVPEISELLEIPDFPRLRARNVRRRANAARSADVFPTGTSRSAGERSRATFVRCSQI